MTSLFLSDEGLLEFLDVAAEGGLLPRATAAALTVASRRVMEVLTSKERANLLNVESAVVVKRFRRKFADHYSAGSLSEYGRRFERALELFKQWNANPTNFSVSTRLTKRARAGRAAADSAHAGTGTPLDDRAPAVRAGASGFQSSFPVRPGTVVTLLNIPSDLTKAEAERLAQFIRMLAVER
jgi:hypothetical protein